MKLLWTVHLVQYIYRSVHSEPLINSEQWRSSCRETFILLCCSLGLCPEREREQTYLPHHVNKIWPYLIDWTAQCGERPAATLFSGKICCALFSLFSPFITYLSVAKRKGKIIILFLHLCTWGYLLYPEASISVAGKKSEVKSRTRREETV